MSAKVVYIAGPFRGANHWEIHQNIFRAEALALEVWRAGAVAICPHLNAAHYQGAAPDSVWLDGDMELLRRSDAVLTTENWHQSEGAKAEVEEARLIGLPILSSIDDLWGFLDSAATPKQDWPDAFKKTLVVGFGHRARQGKDLAVKIMMREFPGKVHRLSFADALKSYCRVARGMRQKDAPMLQAAGVAMRQRDENVWVRAVAWAIAELDADAKENQIVCIPDMRFPNEAEFVKNYGGLLCRVRRIGSDGFPFVAKDRDPYHISEQALADYPWPRTIEAKDGEFDRIRDGVKAIGHLWV